MLPMVLILLHISSRLTLVTIPYKDSVIPTLQMKKLRHKNVGPCPRAYTSSQVNQDSHPGLSGHKAYMQKVRLLLKPIFFAFENSQSPLKIS